MSISNIGEREKLTPRAGKKMLGEPQRPLSPSRIVRAKGRDTLVEDELKAMARGAKERGEENALHFGLKRSEAKPAGKAAVERDMNSDIFGGAKPNVIPPMRLRPDVGEEDLKKIHGGEDLKKQQVAANMAKADTMLDKMYASNYPIARKNEEGPRRKKTVPEKVQVIGANVDPNMEVEGFSGMGMISKPPLLSGISMHPKENAVLKPINKIPVAGEKLPRHNFNTLTGQAQGVSLPGEYVSSTSASYQGY